jgi:hypothetical protein
VFELKGELQEYFKGRRLKVKENSMPDVDECFEDEEWLQKLAYLADIFHNMNQLNKALKKMF